MGRDVVQVQGQLPHAPDDVWSVVRDFCGLWHPCIATMREKRGPQGARIQAFTVTGEDTVYREQQTYLSDSDRVLGYTHLEGIRDCEAYDARVTVTPADGGGSQFGWTATIRAPAAAGGDLRRHQGGVRGRNRGAGRGQSARRAGPAASTPGGGRDAGLRRPAASGADGHGVPPTPSLPHEGGGDGGPSGDRLCLFLHGIGGGRTNWADQLVALGGLVRAAALDLRGYGDSSLGPRQSMVDDYCADILRVADQLGARRLGARRLVLVGLSYGSWIATSFAMRHPDMLDALILSGGCTGMSEAGPDEREAFRVSREVPLNAGQTPADFAPAVVKVLASPGASDDVRQRLFDSMAALPTATYRDALLCFTNPLERFDFSRLTMPVLMMTGEHDRLAPPAEIRAVAGRIRDAAPRPDVRFEVIAAAGHVCNVEQPEAYNRRLLDLPGRLR
ncbi:MAG: alpha/beta fold hydrolase [Tabrizicola sp.]